jgi:predicted nuclease of predicted toxin-antitoxin system
MRFLIDAQLPFRLVALIRAAGFEAVHTLELPDGNRTSDATLNELSIHEQYVLVTKDSDFVESFLLQRKPWKLLLVSTGNIANNELEWLFNASLQKIVDACGTFDFIEIIRTNLIVHF